MKFERCIGVLAVATVAVAIPVFSQEPTESFQPWALKVTASNWWWGRVTYAVTSEADLNYSVDLKQSAEICVGTSSKVEVDRIQAALSEIEVSSIGSQSLSNRCDDEIGIELLVDLFDEPRDALRFWYSEPAVCRGGELPDSIYQLVQLAVELGEAASQHCGQPSLQGGQ